ncbi:hypothetical protein N3K66_000687 [Trichothecium roseum]|uniref:Uncharacterized protein n=1 Tax=Trichothecium roseum TaxID=47278 RepID=A0ACC0VEH8_9HYPO|nr:hypothetical protein N3K66_000687 [Trichothecium roseum]
MTPTLIVGATRGLGANLVKQYAARGGSTVYGTTRSSTAPNGFPDSIKWLTDVDLTSPDVGSKLVSLLGSSAPLGTVFISAGYFTTEDFSPGKGPNWNEEQKMYTTCAIAPVFIAHGLHKEGLLRRDSKLVLVSSESGSITLRHPKEGGGNYGHHASKAALNMVGKLLSLDLREGGVIVSIVHPGFMRTDMTRNVGFDEFWDEGGAVTPDEAAKSMVEWADSLDSSKSGEYWAPRGPGDIGTAEAVLGSNLSTPLKLPW